MNPPATLPGGGLGSALRSLWRHPTAGLLIRAVIAYVVGIEIVAQAIFGAIDVPFVDIPAVEVGFGERTIPRGIFLEGAVIGSLYAFVAIGLILVYRANRIINFAQAQLGAVPAVIALLLVARQGASYLWVAVPIVLVGGAVLGGVTEVTLVRRFRDASRLVVTVATIGIGFLLLVLEFYVKVWLPGDLQVLTPDEFPTPFRDLTFNVGLTRFFGDHVAAVVIAVVAVVGLGVFFRRSDVGIAVRAAAENRDRAALLGIPVARVATIVWVLAGVLSSLGVFLRAPLVGLSLEGFVGPIFLLFGLAAAVIARMEHLPTALIAGVLIGMVDNAVVFATKRNSLALATMLLVILGALLVQRRRSERARDLGASTWDAVRSLRPVPPELRSFPEVRWVKLGLGLAAVAFAAAIPWLIGTTRTGFAINASVFAMVGVSLVILTGWAGQISLGQYGVSGIGAAVAGGLAANHGVDFFVTLVVAGLAGAFVAVIIGLPALRIQGLFLAVTTLAFAFAVENFVLRREYFGWLLPGDFKFVRPPVLWGRIDLNAPSEIGGVTVPGQVKYYWICLVFLVLALGLARSLRRYRSGRVLIGLRDNEPALQAYGVSPAASRLTAFAISGFIAAWAGALLVYQLGTVAPGAFPPEQSIQLFVMTVIGGIGSLMGPILGALFLEGIPQIPGLRDVDLVRVLTTGIGVLLILLLLPGGFAEGVTRLRDRYLRWVTRRRGVIVPSLVADVRVVEQDETHELLVAAGSGAGEGGDG